MMVTVSSKGQIVLPVELRRKYGIDAGSRLSIVDLAGVMYLMPAANDPLAELGGMFENTPGLSSHDFLAGRRRERDRENEGWGHELRE